LKGLKDIMITLLQSPKLANAELEANGLIEFVIKKKKERNSFRDSFLPN
jgi:hypothetical protein